MKRMDQINVIPFIDIMLVLLAIVLTTATFIVEGRLQIRLPAASSQTPPPALERVEIAIDAAGGLFLGGESLGSGSAGLGALEPRLDALTLDTPIVLRVDAEARFEPFIAVVDRLKGRGLERLTILTRQP
ncbi:MAG: biopolymer transporter ExbD [Bdellovibrio bacteriovorus]